MFSTRARSFVAGCMGAIPFRETVRIMDTTVSKFQRQLWGFPPWQVQIKSPQMTAITTDNRK